MKRVHILLTGLSLVIVLLSVNRLGSFTQNPLEPHEFLRWLDVNAMLPIPIASIVLYYLLKKDVELAGEAARTRSLIGLNVVFLVGIYLFGVSSGDHETTNYLHYRFCTDQPVNPDLCAAVAFHDDTFSHLLYYLGVIMYTLAVVAIEWRLPRQTEATRRDGVLILANAAVISVGIFANLAFEPAAIDMVAFGVVAAVANVLLWLTGKRWTQMPFTLYIATAFGAGLAATVLYKLSS
jgi:hypothetical protein